MIKMYPKVKGVACRKRSGKYPHLNGQGGQVGSSTVVSDRRGIVAGKSTAALVLESIVAEGSLHVSVLGHFPSETTIVSVGELSDGENIFAGRNPQ